MTGDIISPPLELFKVGGTLHTDDPFYIHRPADAQLFEQVLAGQFCYILTARQMGKSSLMLRTAKQLRQRGINTAIVDLSGLGTQQISGEQWYLGIIKRISQSLELVTDAETWWHEQAGLTPVQQFTDFLHDVVLSEITTQIVIFIDEIDSTLKLPFTDDFFAAIRFIYNRRASQPEYNRLTFVLLGVATPTDLIRDRNRTPFNVGQAISLREFSRQDAQPLRAGLERIYPGQGDTILNRIFYWTNGHPYLTQKLCRAAVEASLPTWGEAQMDDLVAQQFFYKEAEKEDNLQFVRRNVRESLERRQLMQLYRQVYRGQVMPEDERSPLQNRLRLFGLVRAEDKRLQVRNAIYRRVFDEAWIEVNMPVNWMRRLTNGAILISIATVAFLAWFIPWQQGQALKTKIERYKESFQNTNDVDIRLNALANLCAIDQAQPEAQRLFWDLPEAEQSALFDQVEAGQARHSLKHTIDCLYPAVSVGRNENPPVTQAMCCALHRWDAQAGQEFGRRLDRPCDCPTTGRDYE